MASVIDCVRMGTLGPGNVLVLIEQRAWQTTDKLRLVLRDYILGHPSEVSRICASFIENQSITVNVNHTIEIDKISRDWHWYEATVTVAETQQQIGIAGDGPTYKKARTSAYQKLLLTLCEVELESEFSATEGPPGRAAHTVA